MGWPSSPPPPRRTSWGELGWLPAGTIEPSPWTSSALSPDDAIWLLGGGVGGNADARFLADVRRAVVSPNGAAGAFEAVESPLPLARSHVHQTPHVDGFVYSVGGRTLDGQLTSTDRVFVGTLRE